MYAVLVKETREHVVVVDSVDADSVENAVDLVDSAFSTPKKKSYNYEAELVDVKPFNGGIAPENMDPHVIPHLNNTHYFKVDDDLLKLELSTTRYLYNFIAISFSRSIIKCGEIVSPFPKCMSDITKETVIIIHSCLFDQKTMESLHSVESIDSNLFEQLGGGNDNLRRTSHLLGLGSGINRTYHLPNSQELHMNFSAFEIGDKNSKKGEQ